MRLLSPKEITAKKTDRSGLVNRAATLVTAVKREEEKLAVLKKNRKPEREKLEREFQEFIQRTTKRKGELLKEVADLEERREAALEPLDQLEIAIRAREQAVEAEARRLQAQAAEVSQEKEAISAQAAFIEEKQEELANRELAIREQEADTRKRQEQARDGQYQLEHDRAEFEEQVNAKQLELLEHEKRNFDREQALDVIKESLDKRETDLDNYKRQLDDRAATLERGFKELTSKQNGTSV